MRGARMRWYHVILGLALLGGLWSCLLDWDHVWFWVFKVSDPLNFSGIQGRPFHTVGCFLLQSVFTALVVGHVQSRIVHRRLVE